MVVMLTNTDYGIWWVNWSRSQSQRWRGRAIAFLWEKSWSMDTGSFSLQRMYRNGLISKIWSAMRQQQGCFSQLKPLIAPGLSMLLLNAYLILGHSFISSSGLNISKRIWHTMLLWNLIGFMSMSSYLFREHQWDFLLRPNTLNSVSYFFPSYFNNLELITRHY